MRHVRTLALTAVAGLSLLAGCGGGEPTATGEKTPGVDEKRTAPPTTSPPKRVADPAEYCAAVKATLKNSAKFVSPDDEYLTVFRAAAAKAPERLAPQWRQAVDLMEKLKTAEADKDVQAATAARENIMRVMTPIGNDLRTSCKSVTEPTEPAEPTTGTKVSKAYCDLVQPLFKSEARVRWTIRPDDKIIAELRAAAAAAPADMKPHWDRLIESVEKHKLWRAMIDDPNADPDELDKIDARRDQLRKTLEQDLREVAPNVDRCP